MFYNVLNCFVDVFRQQILPVFSVVLTLLAPVALAHDGPHKGGIGIEHPFAMASATGQANGIIFIENIHNDGKDADQLIGAKSPASATMEVHTMTMEGGVMKMREVSGIEIPAKGKVSLMRGSKEGYHLMLMNLKSPLKDGEKIKATLIFKKAGEIEITLPVRAHRDAHPKDGPMKH